MLPTYKHFTHWTFQSYRPNFSVKRVNYWFCVDRWPGYTLVSTDCGRPEERRFSAWWHAMNKQWEFDTNGSNIRRNTRGCFILELTGLMKRFTAEQWLTASRHRRRPYLICNTLISNHIRSHVSHTWSPDIALDVSMVSDTTQNWHSHKTFFRFWSSWIFMRSSRTVWFPVGLNDVDFRFLLYKLGSSTLHRHNYHRTRVLEYMQLTIQVYLQHSRSGVIREYDQFGNATELYKMATSTMSAVPKTKCLWCIHYRNYKH